MVKKLNSIGLIVFKTFSSKLDHSLHKNTFKQKFQAKFEEFIRGRAEIRDKPSSHVEGLFQLPPPNPRVPSQSTDTIRPKKYRELGHLERMARISTPIDLSRAKPDFFSLTITTIATNEVLGCCENANFRRHSTLFPLSNSQNLQENRNKIMEK